MRFAVLLKGMLRGMGHEAPCELIATKTVVPEATHPVYSHCAIIDAPADLPDGDYEIEFAGEVALTRRQAGAWMVGSILPHTYSEVAKFYRAQEQRAQSPATRKRFGLRPRPQGAVGPQEPKE